MNIRYLTGLAVAAAVLAAGVATALAGPDYVVLTQGLEKSFNQTAGKTTDLRMTTVNEGTFNGWVRHTRTILDGQEVVFQRTMLFSQAEDGDILYHGDDGNFVADEAVTWVDAPLEVGKTWTGSLLLPDWTILSTTPVHYVFAVLEEKLVTCPMGTYPCHRVFVATILPNGDSSGCSFWYNPVCGMIQCDLEEFGTFSLYKSFQPPLPDVDPYNPTEDGDMGVLLPVPNPFNPQTEVRFDLKEAGAVTLAVYDVAGRLVCRLATAEYLEAGPHAVAWDGRDASGRDVPSGVYIARLATARGVASGTMMLVR
jgi:hypothetical protein